MCSPLRLWLISPLSETPCERSERDRKLPAGSDRPRRYRYRHDSREVFRDGRLQDIRSTTDDNGTKYRVEGEAIGGDLRIAREDDEQANGCLTTFAYWDPAFLNQNRLLNAQTGKLESEQFSFRKGAPPEGGENDRDQRAPLWSSICWIAQARNSSSIPRRLA
jgi:hypothetical protein